MSIGSIGTVGGRSVWRLAWGGKFLGLEQGNILLLFPWPIFQACLSSVSPCCVVGDTPAGKAQITLKKELLGGEGVGWGHCWYHTGGIPFLESAGRECHGPGGNQGGLQSITSASPQIHGSEDSLIISLYKAN